MATKLGKNNRLLSAAETLVMKVSLLGSCCKDIVVGAMMFGNVDWSTKAGLKRTGGWGCSTGVSVICFFSKIRTSSSLFSL